MLATRTPKNAFFEFFLRRLSTHPHPRRSLYTPPVHPRPLQRARNNNTQQAARQTTQGTIHTPGHWTRCTGLHSIPDRPRGAIGTAAERWRAWSVSETEQICTHSNMNDFQHKNVCKIIDINTRTCYYIDNTRTCYTTTKQEDKNHDEQ